MSYRWKSASLTVPITFLSLLLGCNSILGIQKAKPSDEPSNECKLDLDEKLVDGCIFRASCDPISPGFTISNCVTYRSQAVFPEERGTLNAASCGPVEKSVGRRYEAPSICPTDQEGWSCIDDGKVALYCGEGRPFTRDCSLRGSVCTVAADAASGAYPCGLPDHIACAADEDRSTFCEGSLQLGCTDGRAVGYDCETVDTECFETDSGATCLPDDGRCKTVGAVSCQSDSKVDYCTDPGVSLHYQCADGTKCADGESGVDCYPEDCTPEAGCKERCAKDGVTIEFCVAGAKVTRDCQDYGFDFCSSYDSTDGTTTFAYCMMNENKPFPGTTADWGDEEPGGTGGGGTTSGPGTGGQGSAEDYCYALDSGACSSLDFCSEADGSGCYFLVNGSSRVDESCDEPGSGTDQVAALCELAPVGG